MSITNPTPGGSFGGDGSSVSGAGRTPGGQFSGIGRIGVNGRGLADSILWIGPEPPISKQFLLWINTSDGRWYGYWFDGSSSQWVDLSLPFGEGLVGPTGLTGDTGLPGPVGQGIPIGGLADQILVKADGTDFNTIWGDRPADGNTIIFGVVDPTTEGRDGDSYINAVTYEFFGPKSGGVWPAGFSLVGPIGETGPIGPEGPTGPAGSDAATNYILGPLCYENNFGNTVYSSSGYATKGNLFQVTSDVVMTACKVRLSSNQTVKAVLAELSEENPGTITAILDESLSQVIPTTDEYIFPIANIVLQPTKFYAILLVRIDGLDTSALGIPFAGATPDADPEGYFNLLASSRYTSIDPAVSDLTYFNTTTTVSMVMYGLSAPFLATGIKGDTGAAGLDGQGVPVGGTAGQVLAKIDSTDYNTEWVDATGGGGPGGPSLMVQGEISADYTLINGDLTGNVVKRVNNATLNTLSVTVPPSLTNEQPITFIATNTGGVTFLPGAGVTLLSADGNTALRVPYSSATIIPDLANAETYYIVGDLVQLTDMLLPASIPAPIVWISPRNVETDVDGNITKFLNRGTGGATYDATPVGANRNTIALYANWNNKDVIVVPDITSNGYALGSPVTNTRTVFTVTSYKDVGQLTFTDFDGLISGPTGAGSELQLVGSSGTDAFLIGANQTIYKNDVAGASVLPLAKDTVATTNSADGLFTQTLWHDNAGASRNWIGANGDMMIWDTELTTLQLTELHTLFTDYFGTGDGV